MRSDDNLFSILKRGVLLLGVVVFCLSGGGCGSRASKLDRLEEDSPLIRKAMEKKRFGDEDAAIALYKKALEKEPTLARAHLELGFLLDSPTRDYVLSIYHYRSYLELRPDTDKKEMIEDRIRMAKLALAASLSPQSSTGAERMMALEKENATLRQENDYLRNEVHDLRDRLRDASSNEATVAVMSPGGVPAGVRSTAQISLPDAAVATSRTVVVSTARIQPVEPMETEEDVPGVPPHGSVVTSTTIKSSATKITRSPTSRTSSTTVKSTTATKVRVYRVQKGDTLRTIAAKVYGNSRRWRDIYLANRTSMRSENDLKVGQTLRIPP